MRRAISNNVQEGAKEAITHSIVEKISGVDFDARAIMKAKWVNMFATFT
jgi:hypothetical protein